MDGHAKDKEPEVRNPLQFWNSMQMAVVFQIVLYLMHWLQGKFGDRGLLATGAILGLTDVDALTISMARGIQVTDWSVAAEALSIGIISNTCLKAAVALILGRGRFRLLTFGGLAGIGANLDAAPEGRSRGPVPALVERQRGGHCGGREELRDDARRCVVGAGAAEVPCALPRGDTSQVCGGKGSVRTRCDPD